MTEAGWDTDAETVAANLESALNMAFDINSPSERVKPVGDNVAAGVGAGMSAHDFSTDASTVLLSSYSGHWERESKPSPPMVSQISSQR